MSVLEESDFDVGNINGLLDSADFELTRAILTFLIRQERFGEGTWGEAAKEGHFLKVLERLKELTRR
ncbi:DUF6508 domain-containing protein [Piscibacillus sp. B03]|uniref:DUF6508 domain-containing protein n=1 Tax=Piscibacillus sp. B03 TaxID=3457430 RepID=UPI003FCDD97C